MRKAVIIATVVVAVAVLALIYGLSSGRRVIQPLVSSAPVAAPAASQHKTIAFIGFAQDQVFWVNLERYAEQEAKARGLNFIDLTPPKQDAQGQAKLVEQALAAHVDGIIFGASDPSVMKPAFDQALAAGTPIITVDTEVPHEAVRGFIATDNLASAKVAGQYIVQATGGKGTVLILGGSVNHPNGDARRDGVMEEVQKAGMKVIFQYTNWEVDEAYQIAQAELAKANDITAVFSANDPNIYAVRGLFNTDPSKPKTVLVGFDGLPDVLREIKSGSVSATVAQPYQEMGRNSVDMMVDLFSGAPVQAKRLILGNLVTRDNVETYLAK